MSGFLQRVNLASLILGQLVIRSHNRLRRELRLKWPREIYQLAFSMPAIQQIALTTDVTQSLYILRIIEAR